MSIPENVKAQLQRLIEEGLPAEQIAFMMNLSLETVQETINTTKKAAVKDK